MKRSLIIFDLNGTLINHELSVRNAIVFIYNKYVENCSISDFINIWNRNEEKYIQLYLNNKITWGEQRLFRVKDSFNEINMKINNKETKKIFSTYLKQYENNWKVYEDVIPTLENVKHNILCIVSNGNSAQQRKKINKTKIKKYFKRVIISEDLNISKPDSRIFEECIKHFDFNRNIIYYVGDNYETDVVGAINTNIIPILINRKSSIDNIYIENKYFEINNLTNIVDIVK